MTRALLLAALLMQGAALAKAPPPARKAVPTDKECRALGAPTTPFAFPVGEYLEYDLDAMGADAGKLTFKVLPRRGESLPIEVTAHTNTFFSKVRKVKATATSFLNPRTLRPHRYIEDAQENDISKHSDVRFSRDPRQVKLDWKIGQRSGKSQFAYAQEALDPVGAIFLLRQLTLKEGMAVCFDAYGIRRMWRVSGKVVGKQSVSLKIGDFEAWHIQGEAVRVDSPSQRREIHLWVSADERRLPLAAVGMIDIGAVRATLTSYSRPGDGEKKAQGKESLKW
jgi:hypothetical protein